MAGTGPAPAETRQRSNEPARGDWQPAPGSGWQHGEVPPCPVRAAIAKQTWATWFSSWFASYWTPEDMPNLRLAIKLWHLSDTGLAKGAERTAYIRLADDLGITRKGQQDRRWKRPEPDRDQRRSSTGTAPARASRATSPAAHLSVVPDADA
jgi:hypothetical protein